jgi:uncharacterized protein (TIGR02246 family)
MATASTHGTPGTHLEPPAMEPSLREAWKAFEGAFNRQDPREVASFWDPEGSLLGPTGIRGDGRSGIEKVFRQDLDAFLRGTRSTFEVDAVRMIGHDVAFVDCTHRIDGARLPDGTKGTMRLHLAAVARRSGDGWRWLDARPYAFLPPPSSSATH